MARDVVRKFIRYTDATGHQVDMPLPARRVFSATMALMRSAFDSVHVVIERSDDKRIFVHSIDDEHVFGS